MQFYLKLNALALSAYILYLINIKILNILPSREHKKYNYSERLSLL